MGPRPIGRGNGDRPAICAVVEPASMGPRPIGRGNSPTACSNATARISFNGAATNWSRKSRACRCCSMLRGKLQWGRDQLVAEMTGGGEAQAGRDGFNGAATNWSRKCHCHRQGRLPPAASMGPRPIGRGNSTLCHGSSWVVQALQWGRDQLVAEICWTPAFNAASGGFNGAATNWSRKFVSTCLVCGLTTCFNGAATNWSRKSLCCSGSNQRRNWLQWGRDQLVAEIKGPCGLPYIRGRFNGAATNWSRKWPAGSSAAGSRAGFNGAATNWSRKSCQSGAQ